MTCICTSSSLCCVHIFPPLVVWRRLWGKGQCLCALCGSTCRNSCNWRSKSLKKIQHQERQLKSAISSKVSWESWSYIARSSSKGILPFQCSPPTQWELFWLSDFCMFLVSPAEQDKYFHSLCIVHNSSYPQFSNSRFLKETKYCRIKFNTIRIPSRKKIPTSPPPNRKAHFNKKHISTSCFPYIYVWWQKPLPYKADDEVNVL